LPAGVVWTAVLALTRVLLAVRRPTTTWHLAPVLLAGAWPWLTGQALRTGDRAAGRGLAGTGAVGFGVAGLGLSRADLLRGPTVFASPAVEALALAGATALLVVLVGLRRAFRTLRTRTAWVGAEQIAVPRRRGAGGTTWCWWDDVVLVEGTPTS
jgi:hypothetical protein